MGMFAHEKCPLRSFRNHREHVRNLSATLAGVSLSLACGCTSTPAPRQTAEHTEAPPISMQYTNSTPLYYYYPDASQRAKEEGRVVVRLTIGATGVPEEPIDIDEQQSTSYPRLLEATSSYFTESNLRLATGTGGR
jgi:outer membrane biosynthesis protein TonB